MDLTKMDRAELAQMQKEIAAVVTSADAMAEGGLEPLISLTHSETVIRARSILSGVPVTEEVCLVEPIEMGPIEIEIETPPAVQAEPEPQIAVSAPSSSLAGAVVSAGAPTPVEGGGGDAQSPAASPGQRPTKRAQPAAYASMVTGPLSQAECADIRDRLAKGETAKQIAAALNRRTAPVAMWISGQARRASAAGEKPKAQETPAGQPAPDLASAATEQDEDGRSPASALGMADPVAPGAGGATGIDHEMLGGDRGGEPRHCPAEHDPVQGVEKVRLNFASTPEAPTDLHGPDREIWQYLDQLKPQPGWDATADLAMCEAFHRGAKAAHVALDMDLDAKLVVERYRLLTRVIRDRDDRMTIEGQTRFIQILRRRAAAASAQTAA